MIELETETFTERLPALIQADPHRTLASLAAELGCTRQRVHQILKELGYEYLTTWTLRHNPRKAS